MNADGTTEDYGAQLLRHARILYRNIASELAKSLDGLRDDEEDNGAKERVEMIRAHRKALQMVLEFEQQFGNEDRQKAGENEIDLAAARKEVYSRLHRIIADVEDREPD